MTHLSIKLHGQFTAKPCVMYLLKRVSLWKSSGPLNRSKV